MTTTTAYIARETEVDFDTLTEVPTVTVRGDALQEGMVLVDPTFCTPAAVIDHKMRTSRGSACRHLMILDLETGRHSETQIRNCAQVVVMAR